MTAASLLLACLATGFPAVTGASEPPSPPTTQATQPTALPAVSNWPVTPGAHAPETPSAPGPRFRFGVGFVSGGTNLANAYPLPTVAGLETRLGVQINDTLAVMYQGSFTLYWPDLRDAVLLEITPTRSFSVGVGLGVDLVSGPIQSPIPNGNDLNLLGLVTTGIPIRLAWNVLASQAPGRRTAMALSLEVTPGLGSVGADSVGVTLSALGGISFEMY